MRMTLYPGRKGEFGGAVVVEERTIYNSGYTCFARGERGVEDLVVGGEAVEIQVVGLKVRLLEHDDIERRHESREVYSFPPSSFVMRQSVSTQSVEVSCTEGWWGSRALVRERGVGDGG